MNIPRLPRIAKGEALRAFHINDTSEAVERLGISVGPGLSYAVTPAGTRLDARPFGLTLWAKITGHGAGAAGSAGGSGPYGWQEQFAQPDGTWADGYLSGTTTVYPAFEANANATVPNGVIVELRLVESTQNWSFIYSLCGS